MTTAEDYLGGAVTPDDPKVLVQLEGISKEFPGPSGAVVLCELNLTVRRGEFIAILGTSGVGKSTLLNILGLLDRPSSGRYTSTGAIQPTSQSANSMICGRTHSALSSSPPTSWARTPLSGTLPSAS